MKPTLILSTDKSNFGKIHEISGEMLKEGLSASFVERAMRLAMDFEGGYDLFLLWHNEKDGIAKNEILVDIENEIEELKAFDGQQVGRFFHRPKIDFDDIENIGNQIISFKKALRNKVDSWGGVARLSAEIGMSSPSLYRFFNSPAMPRKTTLYKIANAVGLEEKDIAFEFTK